MTSQGDWALPSGGALIGLQGPNWLGLTGL